MAYRFDGVDDRVRFAHGALAGHAFGPGTCAMLVKRNTLGGSGHFAGVTSQFEQHRYGMRIAGTNALYSTISDGNYEANPTAVVLADTSKWYLIASTFGGAGTTPRQHVWDGTGWQHHTSWITAPAFTLAGTDVVEAGGIESGVYLPSFDLCCWGYKFADTTDGAVEALSPTSFPSWEAFGFDWLVGFEDAGTVVDRSTTGTGDETSRVGTTLVSDPPGWSWTGAGTTTWYGATSLPVTFTKAVAGTGSTPGGPATWYGAVSRPFTFARVTRGQGSTPEVPPPDELTVTPTSMTEIFVDWEPVSGATSYRVERSTSGGAYTEIHTTTATSYTDTGLDPGSYYAYRVYADAASVPSSSGDAVTDVVPTEGVSIAFGSSLLEPNPAWTRIDVGSVVAEFSIRRGRQDELEKTGTGTASIRLNDRTGAFAPGDLDGRQIALALWNPVTATSHTIFRGFADTYSYDVHPSGYVTYVDVEAVDALDYLAGVEIAPGTAGDDPSLYPDVEVAAGDIWYIGEQVNHRVKALLSEADWPPELMTIFTGNVWVKEQVAAAGTSILSLLGDAADAEFPGVANLYVSKLGKVTFHGRLARFDPDGTAASAGTAWKFTRWKAGDGSATADPSYAQLRGLGFTRDRKRIINAALAYPYRASGVEAEIKESEMRAQIIIDQPSIDAYGLHSWSAESLMTHKHKTNGNKDLKETRLMARYYVENYKEPQTRLTRLELRSLRPEDPRAPATWALMCGVEISDIVRVKAAGFDDAEFYVEGISYDVRPAGPEYHDVTLSLDVSPVAYYDHYPTDDE